MNRSILCCLFVISLQIFSWIHVISKPLSYFHPQQGQIRESPATIVAFKQEVEEVEKRESGNLEACRGSSRIGSRPPNCDHKCKGCVPCDAIQIPEITGHNLRKRLEYANYEPEGWKCKCGSSFFDP